MSTSYEEAGQNPVTILFEYSQTLSQLRPNSTSIPHSEDVLICLLFHQLVLVSCMSFDSLKAFYLMSGQYDHFRFDQACVTAYCARVCDTVNYRLAKYRT